MDEITMSNALPSPFEGHRGNQWSLARAWRELGDSMMRGLGYAWEVRALMVYIMFRFLMVGVDGGRTLFTEYFARLFVDWTTVDPTPSRA